MKNLTLGLLSFCFTLSAQATTSGLIFISPNSTQAKLLINESLEDGRLAQFFDTMKVKETTTGTIKKKSVEMSNKRFSLLCSKGISASAPPSTSCTFQINAGENTADLRTVVSKPSEGKQAAIVMSGLFSHELAGVFPEFASGSVDYFLQLDNGVTLQAQADPSGQLSIEFSGP